MIKDKIKDWVASVLCLTNYNFTVDHPDNLDYGDFYTNVALVTKSDAQEIAAKLEKQKLEEIEKIEVVGKFINFRLTPKFFAESVKEINDKKESYGENDKLALHRIMVEFTDPNPFKEFHIGHLMTNSIGESISRLVEFSGAELKKANYQGDVGLHVAKTVWGKMHPPAGGPEFSWGGAYAYGAQNYEENKEEINGINKKIYDKSDEEVNKIYEQGLTETLSEFERIYDRLGMECRYCETYNQSYFDFYFFESQSGPLGKEIVERGVENGVFEESEGAIVFRAEEKDKKLHTRVFINSQGLPTYEAKELGLLKMKKDKMDIGGEVSKVRSIVVTGNEIREYFKVVMLAAQTIGGEIGELASVTEHLPHGMLRLPSGKMSSRTGDVITAESLIDQIKEKVKEKINDDAIAEIIAIGAIKFSILRQAIGGDIVFDFDKSISFEGDSGPYLQYSAVRANSVLKKSSNIGYPTLCATENWETTKVEKYLYRFPEVVERATKEYAPHHIVTYLLELAGAFNHFYAEEKIINEGDPTSSYKLALTEAVFNVLTNGLRLLAIKVPERM